MHSKNANTPKGDGARSTQHPNSNHQRNLTSDSLNSNTSTATWKSEQISATKKADAGNSSSNPLRNTMPSYTGDKEGKLKLEDKSGIGGIGGWFAGSSPPVTIAVSGDGASTSGLARTATSDSTQSSVSKGTMKRSVSSNMQSSDKPATSTNTPAASSPSPSRFAFFTRSSSSAPKVSQVPSNVQDEWLHLDITTALFPNGPADPFSPSSFKNLLTNAENLLRKLQSAYKERTVAVHELTREKEAQADELEEAETRAEHLKRQLADMGQKLVQQDHDILSISNELAAERQLRAEEKAAYEEALQNSKGSESPQVNNRKSNETSLVSRGSRASFDSYNLEDSDSVFSHTSRSHTSTSSAGTGITTPEIIALESDKSSILSTRTTPRSTNTSVPQQTSTNMAPPPPPQQKSVFSKLLGGGNTSAPATSHVDGGLGSGETGCANCRGGNNSVAWDAVGLLRAENKGLKDRVSLLETGVDDALHLVSMTSLR